MTKLVNRAKMTTATTGTGTITLGTAEAGYQSFTDAGVVDGDVVRYVIEDGTGFEIGTGTFTATGTTLTRTVSESSNADAALNLSGSAVVFVSATAEDIPSLYADKRGTGSAETLATGANSVSIGFSALASGSDSTAVGSIADATAAGSNAFGYSAQAVGLFSTAIGRAYSSGNGSFAANIDTNVSTYGAQNTDAVAIGKNAKATQANSVAIGTNALSETADLMALGGTTTTVQISGTYALPTVDGTTGQVLTTNGAGVVTFADAGGGGTALVLYAENPSGTSSPTATGTDAVAIGDSRGIASGARSLSIGNSLASGSSSFAVQIGSNSSSFGANGVGSIAIGAQTRASNSNSVAVGNQAQSTSIETVAIGLQCAASQLNSVALGSNASSVIRGKYAYAGGRFSATGDAQTGTFVLRSDTTGDTPEALTTNNLAANTVNQIILPNNSAYSFSGTIIARQQASAGSEYAAWEIKGAILRDGTAATTVLGNGIKNSLYASAGAAAWDISLTADTTNGGLAITVTGAAATNIRWVATVNTSEVTF